MTNAPRIKCWRCNKPAERVRWWDTDFEGVRKISVHCHGETETMELDVGRLTFDQIEDISQQEGIAFTPSRETGILGQPMDANQINPPAI